MCVVITQASQGFNVGNVEMLAIPWLTQDLRKRFVETNNKVQCKCSQWLSHKASKAKDEVDEFIIKARQLDTPAHAKELQISIDSEVLTAHVKQVQQQNQTCHGCCCSQENYTWGGKSDKESWKEK